MVSSPLVPKDMGVRPVPFGPRRDQAYVIGPVRSLTIDAGLRWNQCRSSFVIARLMVFRKMRSIGVSAVGGCVRRRVMLSPFATP
jgi:hypothetical protein